MNAPVKFKLNAPTEYEDDWKQVEPFWKELNASVRGNPNFSALTIKGAYVIGTIHGICRSVSYLLTYSDEARDVVYTPAYGVFASAVELLGRCIRGNHSNHGSSQDTKIGFKYLVSSLFDTIPDEHILVRTSQGQYTINQLTDLRHFAAHGQATSQFVTFDNEILELMPSLLANGLERYWNTLQNDEELCNKLARAKILAVRNAPVLTSWMLFEKDRNGTYNSITTIFNRFNWKL